MKRPARSAASTPETGHYFDDAERYIDAFDLPDETSDMVFVGNVGRVYPRLDAQLTSRGL
jgi:4-oxalmesaconate hydratase